MSAMLIGIDANEEILIDRYREELHPGADNLGNRSE